MAVEYNQHTWGYGEELTPDKFNNIEGGVKANADAINEVNNNLGHMRKFFTADTINDFFTQLILSVTEQQQNNGSIVVGGAWNGHFYFNGLFTRIDGYYRGSITDGVNTYNISYKKDGAISITKITGEIISA